MRSVFALVLVAGLALAGAAVWMAQSFMGQQEQALARATEMNRKTGPLVRVFAAKKALEHGAPLTKDDVIMVYLQEKFLPEGVWTDEAALFPTDDERPRYVIRPLAPNEVLMASRITEPGEAAGLTGKLAPGQRAYQIRLEAATGATSLVEQESLIDVYWTGTGSNGDGQITRMIESAMRVVAVDQLGNGNNGSRVVTVAANSEQVARLAQAQASGRLTMALVSSVEDAESALVEVNRNSLLGVVKEEVVAVEAEKVCSIRSRKGTEVIDIPVPCTN